MWDVDCSEEQWQQLQAYLREQHAMGKKKDKKKKKQKTYLLIYSTSESVMVERLTEKEISARVRHLELDDDEFTVIDGKIIGKL